MRRGRQGARPGASRRRRCGSDFVPYRGCGRMSYPCATRCRSSPATTTRSRRSLGAVGPNRGNGRRSAASPMRPGRPPPERRVRGDRSEAAREASVTTWIVLRDRSFRVMERHLKIDRGGDARAVDESWYRRGSIRCSKRPNGNPKSPTRSDGLRNDGTHRSLRSLLDVGGHRPETGVDPSTDRIHHLRLFVADDEVGEGVDALHEFDVRRRAACTPPIAERSDRLPC